jgi:hypothetical protein
VDEALGWISRRPALRQWLRGLGLWSPGQAKPSDPKRAVDRALREAGMPPSSSIYLRLAKTVSVDRCLDPAFNRLRSRLQAWFPAPSR